MSTLWMLSKHESQKQQLRTCVETLHGNVHSLVTTLFLLKNITTSLNKKKTHRSVWVFSLKSQRPCQKKLIFQSNKMKYYMKIFDVSLWNMYILRTSNWIISNTRNYYVNLWWQFWTGSEWMECEVDKRRRGKNISMEPLCIVRSWRQL